MLKKVGLSLMIVCLFVSIVGCKSKKDTLETHNISFVYEDGRVLNETIKDGESLKELTPPTKEGYEFVGWYLNDKEYDFNTKVTSDLKLTAKFKKIEEGNKYTVTFNSDGGTVIPNQIIEENKTIVKPINPIKEGHEFIGWYLNNQVFDFNTKVTNNITLIAKYKKVEEKLNKYTVIFNSDGGTVIPNQIIEENKTIVKPTNPTKKGYKFVGWYLNNKAYNFNTKVTSNITLIAKWEKVVPSKYTVTFNSNGGSAISKQIIEKDKKVVKPTNPTRTGYKFVGWYLNNKAYDFNTKVTSNIILIAKWEKVEVVPSKYTVTFNSNGGSAISKQIIEKDKKVVKPTNPTRTGYKFVGWYLNNKVYDFNTKVTSNIILTAKWNEILTEKIIDVTENIPYTTKKVNEKNMLRNKTSVIQPGVNGKKTVTYKVVYNSQGKEVSKTKLSETVISNPTEQIVKVGISDYNLNTDRYTSGGGNYCLEEDLLVVDGVKVPSCTKNPISIIDVYIKGKTYYYLQNGSSYTNITNKVVYNYNAPGFVNLVYNGKKYGNIGGNGCAGSFDECSQALTEADCNKYGFACGRW